MISQKILSQEKFYELCKRERICGLSYFDFIKMTRDSTTENIEFYIWQSGNWHKLLSDNEKLLSIARENCHFYNGFDYSLTMPKSYLKEILFSFSKAVNKNIFKSLPYNDYRALKKLAAQNDDTIVLRTNFLSKAIFQTDDETITISLPEPSAAKKTFKDFLKEEFYPNPANEQKMPDIASLNMSNNTHNYCYIKNQYFQNNFLVQNFSYLLRLSTSNHGFPLAKAFFQAICLNNQNLEPCLLSK